ncbi:IPT/TIG domain-containing protein [Chitinophaga vietnamensis]|uniref:IPT/TIG domain-containing protein n=1 Tax=Chitinophaga vietnamensis TaxID=2593957 RepID=UPI0011781A22|nr:IPT/TIG domain-containing protein [Chitinophaga vietnamensis]
MKKLKLFVVPLALLMISMIACTPKEHRLKGPGEVTTVKGDAGNFLMIRGHGFSEDRALNRVVFGKVPAQVLHATADYLVVQVPPHVEGTVPVVVAVGSATSNAMMFEYSPKGKLMAVARNIGNEVYE